MKDTGMDISKIVGLIMENPEIIEKIRSLASDSSAEQNSEAEVKTAALPTREASEVVSDTPKEVKNTVTTSAKLNTGSTDRRHALLLALKPYVSQKRSGAIETALGFMDILSIIKK